MESPHSLGVHSLGRQRRGTQRSQERDHCLWGRESRLDHQLEEKGQGGPLGRKDER